MANRRSFRSLHHQPSHQKAPDVLGGGFEINGKLVCDFNDRQLRFSVKQIHDLDSAMIRKSPHETLKMPIILHLPYYTISLL